MGSGFSEREQAFENKWAHDEELKFRVLAHRNRLLGLWAAGEMGLTGPAADEYAAQIVQAELSPQGDEAVFREIRADFDTAGTARTDHLIRSRMVEFLQAAKAELAR